MTNGAQEARLVSEEGKVVIRPATPDEAGDLFRLISDNLETGHLLPRPLGEVVLHVPRFVVASDATRVIGCAELARLGPHLAEVRSLVVADDRRGCGIGTGLLNRMLHMAREHGYARLCAFAYNRGSSVNRLS